MIPTSEHKFQGSKVLSVKRYHDTGRVQESFDVQHYAIKTDPTNSLLWVVEQHKFGSLKELIEAHSEGADSQFRGLAIAKGPR